MKVIEDVDVFPPRKHFIEVESKFNSFSLGCRVLPAPYFEEPNTRFTLKKRYEIGEKKSFPKGGFEVYGPDGGTYNYELDQVIVHPYELKMKNFFSKVEKVDKEKVSTGIKGKRGRPKMDPSLRKTPTQYVPTGGKRGRKPMDPVLKAAKLAAQANKKTGKRGRPRTKSI